MPPFPGVGELLALLAFAIGSGGLLGLPLSVPPLPPDPVVQRAAPDACVFHVETAGLAAPAGGSKNLTERMLADPDMREFLAALVARLSAAAHTAAQAPPELTEGFAAIVEVALTRPMAFTVEKLRPPVEDGPPLVAATLVIRTGDRGTAFAKTIDALLAPLGEAAPETVRIGGGTWQRLPLPANGPLSWGTNDGTFIVAVGEQSHERLVTRLGDAGRKGPAWRSDLEKKMPVARRSTLTYLDARAAIETLAGMPVPDRDRVVAMLEASGLAKLDVVGAITGMTAEGVAADLWLGFTGGPTGLFARPATGIGAKQLARVPADATLAQSWSLDLSKTFAAVLDVAEAADPQATADVRKGLARFRAVAGLDLDSHLLAPLGPDWTVVSLPAAGGLLPNIAIIAGVRDRPTFAQTHKALLGVLRNMTAEADTKIAVREVPYRGTTLFCLEASGPDVVLPLTPTWCLTDDALFVTLSPQLMKTLLARVPADGNLGEVAEVRAAVAGGDPAVVGMLDPHTLVATLCALYEMAAPAARSLLLQQGLAIDLPHLPPTSAIMPFVKPSVSIVRHEADGIRIRSTGSAPLGPLTAGGGVLGVSPASAPVLVGLLLPAVQSAREAARRTQAMNNLRQLAIAMLIHEDAMKRLPAQAICDQAGRPLLSWRVALLPYLEEQQLYREFRLDEPWDSDHNRKLIPRMPACLADPAATPEEVAAGLTTFQVLTGANTPFCEPGAGITLGDIADGASLTLAVVEVSPDHAVPWTKPEDHAFDPARPLDGLGNPRRAGGMFLGAFFDGHIEAFAPDILPDVFKALATPAAGEVVGER